MIERIESSIVYSIIEIELKLRMLNCFPPTHMYMYVCLYAYEYSCVYACMRVCVCVFVRVCVCPWVHVCTFIMSIKTNTMFRAVGVLEKKYMNKECKSKINYD